MEFLKFDMSRCDLCGQCIEKCPFGALQMEKNGITATEKCRMCSVCVKTCPQRAIRFEQVAKSFNKDKWKGILVYAEQENGAVHPVVYELIGEARKLAAKVGYDVNCVMVGGAGTKENAEKLLPYGVKEVFVYEHPGFEGFKADCYSDAVADCISAISPSCVLIGATACGRSLAPRLSTRFHTGLTADCTELQMKDNTDLVQIRPAFGGNIMAQIVTPHTRPQFCTVRYKVFSEPKPSEAPSGEIVPMAVTEDMLRTDIRILFSESKPKDVDISEADVIVAVGRGALGILDKAKELADLLGGVLACTRPLVEENVLDAKHQIGLSGRTVKPKLIITLGISGAVQFAAGMKGSNCIVAINSDPTAPVFDIAHYCVTGDVNEIVPKLIAKIKGVS